MVTYSPGRSCPALWIVACSGASAASPGRETADRPTVWCRPSNCTSRSRAGRPARCAGPAGPRAAARPRRPDAARRQRHPRSDSGGLRLPCGKPGLRPPPASPLASRIPIPFRLRPDPAAGEAAGVSTGQRRPDAAVQIATRTPSSTTRSDDVGRTRSPARHCATSAEQPLPPMRHLRHHGRHQRLPAQEVAGLHGLVGDAVLLSALPVRAGYAGSPGSRSAGSRGGCRAPARLPSRRRSGPTWGMSSFSTVTKITRSCSTLLCFRLCSSAPGT